MRKQNYIFDLILSILFLLLSGEVTFAQTETVSGKVFLDENKNRLLDKNEKGIAGVAVSNQKDVVVTQKDGSYKIAMPSPCVLFVSIPSAYKAPVNNQNIPQFFYVHQPNEFKTEFAGLNSTGKLPKEINFPLLLGENKDNFTVCYLGDIQSVDSTQVGYMRDDLLPCLLKKDFDFVLTLGDVIWDNLSMYDYQNKIIASIGKTVFNTAGNHDMNYDGTMPWTYRNTWIKQFGPNYYSFNYGSVHFVQLDNIEPTTNGYIGRIGSKQLTWLANDLKNVDKDKLLVINMHIPLHCSLSTGENNKVVDKDSLFSVIREFQNVAFFAGHTHTLELFQYGKEVGWNGKEPIRELVCSTVCGSWWGGMKDWRGIPYSFQADGTPNGFHLLHFTGNTFVNEFVASDEKNTQLRISSPRKSTTKQEANADSICVNFFNAGFHPKITALIDGKIEIVLSPSYSKDIYVVNEIKNNPTVYTKWYVPENTRHIFKAKLPDLETGIHHIEITATNENGNIVKETGIFELK